MLATFVCAVLPFPVAPGSAQQVRNRLSLTFERASQLTLLVDVVQEPEITPGTAISSPFAA